MLQILIITMREGIEAFLIVAITAGILRQTGRAALLPALYWGTGIAIGVSFVASWFFAQAENKPLWEGFLAAAAAVMVVTMTVYMWRTARTRAGRAFRPTGILRTMCNGRNRGLRRGCARGPRTSARLARQP